MQLHRCVLRLVAALAILGASAPAEAGPLTAGPYLQALGPTGVTVRVELSAPEALSVEIDGPTGDASAPRVTSSAPAVLHSVRVDGLSPATTYEYRVAIGAAKVVGRFTTAPPDDRPFRFLVYGDNRSDPAAHAAVVRAMEAAPSDFLVHTGDMVARGEEVSHWRSFFEIENTMLKNRCVFAAIGNHELTDGTGAAFVRYFGVPRDEHQGLYGTFRWSNTRFFMLDAMDAWTGEQVAWLDGALGRALAEPGLVHRIAVLHHGPFSSGPHGPNPRLPAGDVVGLLARGRVDLLLAGHDHTYERGEGRGLKYLISGGGGAPLYERKTHAPETLAFESVHHFVEIAVDGDKLDVLARRASGSVIERCGFRGNGPWECDKNAAKPTATAPPVPTTEKRPEGLQARSCLCASPGVPGPTGTAPLLPAALALLAWRRRRA